jgi:hypothetical protein
MNVPASGKVAAFDDTNWKVKISTFQQYLVDCQAALAVSQTGYTDAIGHIDTDTAKAQKPVKQTRKAAPVVSSAKYQARHVYLMSAGVSREPVDCNPVISLYRQPLWASMGEVSERKAA